MRNNHALLSIFQHGAAAIEYPKQWCYGPLCSVYCPYQSAYQIWCNSVENWPIYALLCIFQHGGRRNFEFPKSAILYLCITRILPISAHQIWCKFVKRWSRYALLCIFQHGDRRHLEYRKKLLLWTSVFLFLPIPIIIPNLRQIGLELTDICLCIFQDGVHRHLECPTSAILDWHLYCAYLSAYQIWCKSVNKWPSYACCVFSKAAAAAISKKCYFEDPVVTFLLSLSVPNWVQIGRELAEICPFVYFPRWRPPPAWLSKSAILDAQWHLYCPYLSVFQMWYKSVNNWSKYAFLFIIPDGGRRHVRFVISTFWIIHNAPLLVSVFHSNGVMMSPNLSEILWFYRFAMCLFQFSGVWGILTP